jgi:hypothetical protein
VGESRFVAGAGTTANIVVGAISLAIMNAPRQGIGSNGANFSVLLWLFAAFNLLNCGYLVVSAVLGSGDWAVVTKDLSATGVAGCSRSRWRHALCQKPAWARALHDAPHRRKDLAGAELRPLLIAAYVAGGALMTVASVFNPISSTLILVSGRSLVRAVRRVLLFRKT